MNNKMSEKKKYLKKEELKTDYCIKLENFKFKNILEAEKFKSKNVILIDSFTALDTPFTFRVQKKVQESIVKRGAILEESESDSSLNDISDTIYYGDIDMYIDLFVNGKQLINTQLHLERGKIYGLVGRNGIGKTSLLKAMKKKEFGINKDLKVHLIKQDYSSEKKVKDFVGFDGRVLSNLGFTKDMMEKKISSLSGGWRMRAQLARAVFKNPDLLLLDEPTNFLDIRGISWLEKQIPNLKTVVIVSHDRKFLDNTVDSVLFLDDCKIEAYKGNYQAFRNQRDLFIESRTKEYKAQQNEILHIESFVNRFRANAARSSQAQSRLKILEKMKIIEMPKVEPKMKFRFPCDVQKGLLVDIENLRFTYNSEISNNSNSSNVINCYNSNDNTNSNSSNNTTNSKIINSSTNKTDDTTNINTNSRIINNDKIIFNKVDFKLNEKSRIVIVGENGQGKSTFLKLLTGRLEPTSGRISLHQKTKVGYFAQHHVDHLDHSLHTISYLMTKYEEEPSRAALSNFGLNVKNQKIGTISGGQKSRLAFAALSLDRPNVLVLDEPTNHLDIETIDALASAFVDFEGAVVAVSHDLAFIEKVFDEVYVCDNKGLWRFNGDVSDYKDSLKMFH